MPAYDAFVAVPAGTPSESVSWSLELTSDLQLKGTLEIIGLVDTDIGNVIEIGSLDYKVTAKSVDTRGTSQVTSLVLRNLAYDLNFKTPELTHIYISAPPYILRQEWLNNMQRAVHTKLLASVPYGTIFGKYGWSMDYLISTEVAKILGMPVSYDLPDFWVRQVTLDRTQSILDTIRSWLAPLMPRIYVLDGTLHVAPAIATSAKGVAITVLETISTTRTLQEPYKKFRVNGGEGPFKKDKWEGVELSTEPARTIKYWISKRIGYVSTETGAGTRRYWTKVEDTTSTTLLGTVYATDPFGNDAAMIFKEEWRFRKREPALITNLEQLDAEMDKLQEYTVELDKAPDPPSTSTHTVEHCVITVNVFKGMSIEWEQPLLTKSYEARWQYLWWSSEKVAKPEGADTDWTSPPAEDVPKIRATGEDAAFSWNFPSGHKLTITPLAAGTGYLENVKGVWSTDARMESIAYKYQYDKDAAHDYESADEYEILGGLLRERNHVVAGIVRNVYPSIRQDRAKGDYHVENKDVYTGNRLIPAYEVDIFVGIDPHVVYPITKPYRIFVEEIEQYDQVNRRVVQKKNSKTEMVHDPGAHFMDTRTPDKLKSAELQYKASSYTELVPYHTAPQTLVKKRGMIVYHMEDGTLGAQRWAEVNFPLIISWDEMESIASKIKEIHPSANSIITTTVTTPEVVNLSLSLLGSKVEFRYPGIDAYADVGENARIVAGVVTVRGDGTVFSQLAIQGEKSA